MGGTTATEEYNGATWTAVGALPISVAYGGGGGLQSAAFITGGLQGGSLIGNTYEYTKVFTIVDRIL